MAEANLTLNLGVPLPFGTENRFLFLQSGTEESTFLFLKKWGGSGFTLVVQKTAGFLKLPLQSLTRKQKDRCAKRGKRKDFRRKM